MVLGKQQEYRNEVFGTIDQKPIVMVTSRPAAIYVLRSYLRLCMPMTIETEVNNTATTVARGGPDALMTSPPLISASNAGTMVAPAVRIQTQFGPDKVSQLLTQWLKPGGVLDRNRRDILRDFVTKLKPGLQVTTFLTGPDYAAQRAQFARDNGVIQ